MERPLRRTGRYFTWCYVVGFNEGNLSVNLLNLNWVINVENLELDALHHRDRWLGFS